MDDIYKLRWYEWINPIFWILAIIYCIFAVGGNALNTLEKIDKRLFKNG
jgi:hypothetical protein